MVKGIFKILFLLLLSFSLVACKGERQAGGKADKMELLVQETQKRLKVEKNKAEIEDLVGELSKKLEKNHEAHEIKLKPDYILYKDGKPIFQWTIDKRDIVVSAYNDAKKKLADYLIVKDDEDFGEIKNKLEDLTKLVK